MWHDDDDDGDANVFHNNDNDLFVNMSISSIKVTLVGGWKLPEIKILQYEIRIKSELLLNYKYLSHEIKQIHFNHTFSVYLNTF